MLRFAECDLIICIVRGSLFEALGRLCELFPEFMVAHSKRLIGVYMKVLKSEVSREWWCGVYKDTNGCGVILSHASLKMSSKKPELLVIAGCLKGLCSYLVNFSQSVAEGKTFKIVCLYVFIILTMLTRFSICL